MEVFQYFGGFLLATTYGLNRCAIMGKEATIRMRAVEFESTVALGGQISVPPEIASQIPPGEQLRVVLMWEPPSLDIAWRDGGRERFEAAYSPEDAVYEQLIDDAAIR